MKRFLLFSTLTIALAACDSTVPQSSRPPAGNPDASIVVVEFADLQCPACRAAHSSIVEPILEKYGNQIRYEFMHFPLRSIHRYALEAGEAAECAADQGKFWEYIAYAFEHQDDLNTDALVDWASAVNLNRETFQSCLSSGDKEDIVLSDYKVGRDMGVNGTPTFFVNGQRVENGFDTLSAAIDAQLNAGSSMPL